jgi:transposase
MAISLPDARQLPDQILEALRLRALRGCEMGLAHADVAHLLGVCPETVSRWWTAYTTQGLDALPHERTGRPLGSGRLLDDQQAQHLQELIDGHSPEDLGIAAPLWSRRAVRDLILQEYALRLPVRTVGKYLKRWGYTAKRPRRHARGQDPDEVHAWLSETYPLIKARAQQEGAEIFWGDETGVAADQHPPVGYARKGEPATVSVPDSHVRVNVVSAISNTGTLRFMTYTGTMNAALFIVFLGRLLRTTTRKLFLIVDRLPAHETAKVDAWAEAHHQRLELFYLPGRAPERNPDEYLNNDLKGSIHEERLPENKPELRSQVQRWLRTLFFWPAHIVSYFQHPEVQYAAAPSSN